ncbi:CRISPR-associated helicase/endonuclease Cas3 [Spirochaeta cellobiosiphila]|uniref:CRISPR-associated helicase/endonuclease Cas3 n=1 Tax=Spirochaeta cellobiosiphila TaxID=504483 RepID=UPI00040B3E28|nr:CRISPR-associated helicase/endonuclease Cas3 [Spirochaeta cellobiosiphila]
MILKKPKDLSDHNQPALDLQHCIAKTIEDEESGQIKAGQSIELHCKIVGLVARELLSRMPDNMRNNLYPKGAELVAAAHDIGKVNPLFQEKIRRNLSNYQHNSEPSLKGINPNLEKETGYHWTVSRAALSEISNSSAMIVGQHHGVKPNQSYSDDKNIAVFGGSNWQKVREKLILSLEDYLKEDWPIMDQDEIWTPLNILGLTTVSDWIGSGPALSNILAIESEDNLIDLVRDVVDKAGFVVPQIKKGLSFAEVFDGYNPRPMQEQMIDMVQDQGLYILEDRMGQGKTEAALYAAYRLMERGLASGIYFALPTQLTSEKIHERFERFLDCILDSTDQHRSLLVHSKSWLLDTEMGEDGRPGYSWFNSRKRGLLAPFAVGTIDQALMSVMNVKHGFVRAFGLAGKVVILDEVHSYDAYTGTIIDHLVRGLRELGATVIMLSATLTTERKKALLSYTSPMPHSYPLLSYKNVYDDITYSQAIETEQKTYILHSTADEESVNEFVMDKAQKGQYVLWIENTVEDAQKVFLLFANYEKELGIEVGLIHSRFLPDDRARLEEYWTGVYGKIRGSNNKGGKILVGTQVLEQSLDIDADFLVTRLAPMDMLLQRMGRLWRHSCVDPYRTDEARPEVFILMPNEEEIQSNSSWCFGPSGAVYSPYILARSAEVLAERSNITLPEDFRSLIEAVYAPRKDPTYLNNVKSELEQRITKLGQLARVSLSMAVQISNDDVSTRYTDVETVEVLIIKDMIFGSSPEIILVNGARLSLSYPVGDRKAKRQIAQSLSRNIMTVPISKAPDRVIKGELSILKPFLYIEPDSPSSLRVIKLKASGMLEGLNGRPGHDQYELYYSQDIGYQKK